MDAREALTRGPQIEEVVDDEPAQAPAAPSNPASQQAPTYENLPVPPKPKVEDQKFKRVLIEEDSDEEEE